MKPIKILKANGQTEEFSEDKFRRSLKKSGADGDTVEGVVQQIGSQVKDGTTTKQIYRKAYALLKQYAGSSAARYKTKQAIHELGPSGFPFELFVAELLKQEGYQVQTGVIVEGHCVKHEIDVIAEKEEQHFMVECKFHNKQGIYCDVKVPLYIQFRFLDVEKKWKVLPGHEGKFHRAMIFTNTRFTVDAIAYSTCMEIDLVSWDYPVHASLMDRINKAGLHPLTCLTSLTTYEKKLLLAMRVVLCKQICDEPERPKQIGIKSQERINKILKEGELLCRQASNLKQEV